MGSNPTSGIIFMAAQRTPHTPTQISGLLSRKAECPKCNKSSFVVLESRRIVEGKRRRYACESCNHRETRYEIDASSYSELVELRQKFNAISRVLLGDLKEPIPASTPISDAQIPCTSCGSWTRYGCAFEFPEANTPEAIGCQLYSEE